MKGVQRHVEWLIELPADEFVLLRRAWFRLLWIWVGQKFKKNTHNEKASSLDELEQKSKSFKSIRLAVIRAEKYHFIQTSERLQRLTVESLIRD